MATGLAKLDNSMQGSVEPPLTGMMGKTGLSWLLLGVFALLLAVFYGQTAVNMVGVWEGQATYNYAYLIPMISLYVFYQKRDQLPAIAMRADWLGVAWTGLFACLWLVADAADVAFGRQLAFIGMLQGIILAALGKQFFWKMIFPVQYLWLGLPVWDFLNAPLQRVSLFLSVPQIKMMGIPTFVDGLLIEVPSGLYRVAPECSGLNFLLAALALSSLYAQMMYQGWRKRILTVVISLVVAILANGVRIGLIIGYNHFAGDSIDIGGDHITWGWGFFAIILLAMIWLGSKFPDPAPEEEEIIPATDAARPTNYRAMAVVLLGTAAVLSGPAFYAGYIQGQADGRFNVSLQLPDDLAGLKAGPPSSDWQPQFHSAHWNKVQSYGAGRDKVDLFLAYYAAQNAEHELVAYENILFDRDLGQVDVERLRTVSTRDGDLAILESVISTSAGSRLVWTWFWVGGENLASRSKAKLVQARISLLNGDRRAAQMALSTLVRQDPEGARERLSRIMASDFAFNNLLSGAEIGRIP